MAVEYSLTPTLTKRLKEPIGTLIRGSFTETLRRFKEMIEKEKTPRLISVGDTVTKNLTENNILPQLAIVDNKCMRKNIQPIMLDADETICVSNPPGTITREAITAIQNALKSKHRVRILVEGEEDLLTLIAVLYAPEDSLVVYGQPYEGIVVVRATPQKKEWIAGILKAMEGARKAK